VQIPAGGGSRIDPGALGIDEHCAISDTRSAARQVSTLVRGQFDQLVGSVECGMFITFAVRRKNGTASRMNELYDLSISSAAGAP